MKKIVAWLVIIAAAGIAYLLFPDFFRQSYGYLEKGNIAGLADYLKSFGAWSIAVIIALFVVMTFTIVFPFMILSGATGIMYGFFWGVVLSWIGEVAGALCMFFFARGLFRNLVAGFVAKSSYLRQVDDYSAANGFKALLLARLLPLAPSGIITAVAAISRISFRDFIIATVVGKLPPVAVKVMLGYDLVFAREHPARLAGVAALIAAVYGLLWLYKRKKRGENAGQPE